MSKMIHQSARAPKPVGPYSVGVSYKDLLFISGQIPVNPITNEMVTGSLEAETRQVLDNLKNLLEDFGSSLEDVLKVTVFLIDMKQFAAFNAIYAEYFKTTPPARSVIQVGALPKGANVEVEAIAIRKGA